jgi:hypothetical protein
MNSNIKMEFMKNGILAVLCIFSFISVNAQRPDNRCQNIDPQKLSIEVSKRIGSELELKPDIQDSIKTIFYIYYLNMKEAGRANFELKKMLEFERNEAVKNLLSNDKFDKYLVLIDKIKEEKNIGPKGPQGPRYPPRPGSGNKKRF